MNDSLTNTGSPPEELPVRELAVQTLGPLADGIVSDERGRVFVDRGLPDDRVIARLKTDREGQRRAEIIEILHPSPLRQAAPCPLYDKCGNCSLQHLQLDYYKKWKVEQVESALKRHGVRPQQWLKPVYIGDHQRRRATFTVQKQRDRLIVGYYQRRAKLVTDIYSCLVADPRLLRAREVIKPFLIQHFPFYKSIDVFLQLVGEAVDMLITGYLGGDGLPTQEMARDAEVLVKNSLVRRVSWRSTEDGVPKILATRGAISARFGLITVALPPGAFMQPTLEGERILGEAIRDAVPFDTHQGSFADLFSGCGTFSGLLVDRGTVDAYEACPGAVQALGRAARSSPLRVYSRDLYRNPLRPQELNQYDAVVFDPPRGGCPEQAIELAKSKTPLLVGISCNPATFARDAKTLCDGGYKLKSVQVIDQFQWSHHVELVGIFVRGTKR